MVERASLHQPQQRTFPGVSHEIGERPLHYIGGLTAPADEAELAAPEPPAPEPGGAPRWRVALGLLLLALAAGYYLVDDPARLDRLLAHARALAERVMGAVAPAASDGSEPVTRDRGRTPVDGTGDATVDGAGDKAPRAPGPAAPVSAPHARPVS